jgi:phospholipid/cholesterol/gamma-HCH transport system permease protein
MPFISSTTGLRFALVYIPQIFMKKDEIHTANKAEELEPSSQLPLKDFFHDMGDFTKFTGKFFKDLATGRYEFKEFINQCYLVGNKSLPLVGATAFIMGLVFTIQSRPTLVKFGAQTWLPAMVAIAMIREIAPVTTALICAGKVGSGIGAELSSMRVTEQIDAMEVSGNLPFKYLVVTRICATTLMVPFLCILADVISLGGCYSGVNLFGHMGFGIFFSHIFQKLDFNDVFPAVIKSFFFGFAIGAVACYKGYYSNEGTAGVGRAANAAVVIASLVIFIVDMIAVQLANIF